MLRKQAPSMAVHPTTNNHRKAVAPPKLAAKQPLAAVKAHSTAAPKRDHPLVVMSKSGMIERVAHQSGKSVKETSVIVNATLDAICEALKRGDSVGLTGFGSFGVRTRAAHKGVNPQTRARIQVPAKQHVHFSAGKGLSDAVAR
jgi:DNA-binding protein HU-beta